jgi:hypothetical protein
MSEAVVAQVTTFVNARVSPFPMLGSMSTYTTPIQSSCIELNLDRIPARMPIVVPAFA